MMFNVKTTLARLALAGLMFLSAGMAAATPVYHVSIDTSSLGHAPAYLGLSFLSLAGASNASATITNLSGNLAGDAMLSGSASGSAPGPIVFSNAGGGADLVQAITLGGLFSFDVAFNVGSGADGATFSWSLFDDTQYLGKDGDLGSFFLTPGAAPAELVAYTPANAFSSVAEAQPAATVPEPASIALLLAGVLGLFAATRHPAYPLRRRGA